MNSSDPTGRPQIVNNPIRADRSLRRFEFLRSRPDISAECALVLIAASGRATTYGAERLPTRGELVVRDHRKLYEVDLGRHHQSFEFSLPSQGDAFFFRAEVDVSWWVRDPETVVRRGIRDVRVRIEPAIRRLITSRTRQFAIENSAAAEAAANDALAAADIGAEDGLQLECQARLSLDSEALAHFAALRQSGYETVQAAARHEGAKAAARQGHELDQQKIDYYTKLFADDDDLWALMLARKPEDLPLVLEGRRTDQRAALATRLALIEKLIDSGHLEEHMLEEPTQMAADILRQALGSAAEGGIAERPIYKQQLPARDQLPPRTDDDR